MTGMLLTNYRPLLSAGYIATAWKPGLSGVVSFSNHYHEVASYARRD